MNWSTLKEEVYFEDSSLRDLYVLDTSAKDWEKWVDLVNRTYKVQFYNGQTKQKLDKIDFQIVKEYWDGRTDLVNYATIRINNFEINCYFFNEAELENNIHPKQFQSLQDHSQLMEYLIAVSRTLGKKMLMTLENSQESPLIEVENENVDINCG